MTYSSDPTRWSSASGIQNDAPELLREAFGAGAQEGPSNLQMRALALKLAAVGTGAALAAGAATAQASTTAAGGAASTLGGASTTALGGALAAAKTGGALTLSKIAVSLALVGAAATGAVMLRRNDAEPVRSPGYQAQVEATLVHDQAADTQPARAVTNDPMRASLGAPVQPTAAQVVPTEAPSQAILPTRETREIVAPSDERDVAAETREVASAQGASNEQAVSKSHRAAHVERHAGRASTTTTAAASSSVAEAKTASAERVSGGRQQVSEIELLRSARSALAARPREAYRLTEAHKAQYPQGVFAQERDALAVEAVQRAGDLKLARRLAEAFVKSYPSSPHAHRFRETMNLQ